jgi:hypothetical protein
MTDVISAARAIWRRQSMDLIADSALAGMPRWLETGSPPPADDLRRQGFTGAGERSLRYLRKGFVNTWGCSIPCREAVELLRPLSPLVEVGAGTGYWSALLAAAGLDVVATDLEPELNSYGAEVGRHFPVRALDAVRAVEAYPERNVFCSWPTLHGTWLTDAARLILPGKHLALIAEDRGGVTADAGLFDLLDHAFTQSARLELPQFPPHLDRLTIWRRR